MIETERLIIRKHKTSDIDALVKLINDKTIHVFTHVPYPYRVKDAKEFLKISQSKERRGYAYQFGVFLKETGQLVGGVGILKVRKRDESASLGYWISPKFRGKNYAIEAIKGLIDWAFKEKKFNRIEIACSTVNVFSRYIIQKLGATSEGTARKAAKLGGKFHDMAVYSVLKSEWSKLKKQTKKKVHIE